MLGDLQGVDCEFDPDHSLELRRPSPSSNSFAGFALRRLRPGAAAPSSARQRTFYFFLPDPIVLAAMQPSFDLKPQQLS
jgi:hypothetical protein